MTADLTKMPHLLIAGSTGSGKTVCLNTIVCCLLMYNTPDNVRFILVDPKRVELTQYNSIPHLATPVIVDSAKAISALRWVLEEMDQRYKKMAATGARNIEGYNKDKQGPDKLPYLVLVIDELADLMMAGFDEVESSLCRLAQLARATGIHLVVGDAASLGRRGDRLIKANFPTRISFAVTSQVDSRTILDSVGAEKLLGKGDMLYMPTEAGQAQAFAGVFPFRRGDRPSGILLGEPAAGRARQAEDGDTDGDRAVRPDRRLSPRPAAGAGQGTGEAAQRCLHVVPAKELHIGYPRAARLKDQLDAVLHQEGITVKENGDVAEETEQKTD